MTKNLYTFSVLVISTFASFAQGAWTAKANFTGTKRQYGASFTIGTKAYIFGGLNCTTPACYYNDLWEWDQASNIWTQRAPCPGVARRGCVAFSIGTKGYISCGSDLNGVLKKDLWEWDQGSNTWLQKTDFPGTAREDATAFSISGKGYVGCGKSPGPKIDWFEYNPGTDSWLPKLNFPGTGRYAAVGFSIGGKGYQCTGFQGGANPYVGDLWEFDPIANSWTPRAALTGDPRIYASGFSIGTKAYIAIGYDSPTYGGLGVYNDFWEWDQFSNTWSAMASIPAASRAYGFGFSLGTKGYISMGGNAPTLAGTNGDLWEWGPTVASVSEHQSETGISYYPNPVSTKLNVEIFDFKENLRLLITDVVGKEIMYEKLTFQQTQSGKAELNISEFNTGIYFLNLFEGTQLINVQKLIKE